MSAHVPLIRELEEVIRRGSPARRARMIERITAFFLVRASQFGDAQVRVFDPLFSRLLPEIGPQARSEISRRLAVLANAPGEAVRRLAHDRDIAVAGPMLRQSPRLADPELLDIAERMGQAHLLAIAARAVVGEAVADVLVRRGDRALVHRLLENRGARFSDEAIWVLAARAETDRALAEKIGLRPDLSARLRDLQLSPTQAVKRRLLASPSLEPQSDMRAVQASASDMARRYAAAQRRVDALRQHGRLGPAALADLANNRHYDETVAALAALCVVPIEVVDRLMGAERPDPVLILCRSAGWDWPVVEAILALRARGQEMTRESLNASRADFERLSPTTAQHVLRFWQARPDDGGPTEHGTPTTDER